MPTAQLQGIPLMCNILQGGLRLQRRDTTFNFILQHRAFQSANWSHAVGRLRAWDRRASNKERGRLQEAA